jgi:hypothetical protein
MVTQTPRFDLNKYSQGEDNWSHSDTIDFVDEYSIDKGPVADRPTTGDYDDQLYFATDQGLFWRWDSNVSDWTTDAFGTESNRVPDTSYFDGVDANSLSADALENGVAGSGNTITAIDGNENEQRLLASAAFESIDKSFTNTSFSSLTGLDEQAIIDLSNANLTNISQYKIVFIVRFLENDTSGETTSIRINIPGVTPANSNELTVTGGSDFTLRSVTDVSLDSFSPNRADLEAKVTAGTGRVRGNILVQLYGVIG